MIQSVARALALLETLDQHGDGGLALGQLAANTELKAPTAHHLLQTLVGLNYVTHAPDTRCYALGEKAWTLGRRRFLPSLLAELARPVLRSLRDEFDETVLLALYRDHRRHTIAAVESRQSLRVGQPLGADDRLYSTATGRILLSLLDQNPLARFVRHRGEPGDAWPEAAIEAALWEQLRRIRRRGFVVYHPPASHVQAIAVPVRIAIEAPISLGMYYPTVRVPVGGIHRVHKRLREAADEIATQFEHRK